MRHVEMTARIRGREPREAYAILSRLSSYPEHTEAVRSVTVASAPHDGVVSTWEVTFRNGILRWTEEDQFDPAELLIRFRQLEGDVDYFAGFWKIEGDRLACTVSFVLDFDLGIPSLSHIIDPIAEHALFENFQKIILGLMGAEHVESVVLSSATPERPADEG
jgi:ribosome-associated toxin RatA of RatAB toxin-antitoxin module